MLFRNKQKKCVDCLNEMYNNKIYNIHRIEVKIDQSILGGGMFKNKIRTENNFDRFKKNN